jgi:hypothetical protein
MRIKDTIKNFKKFLTYVSLDENVFRKIYTRFIGGTSEFHGLSSSRTLYAMVQYTPDSVEIDRSLDVKEGKKLVWKDGEMYIDPGDIAKRMKNFTSGNIIIDHKIEYMKVSGKMKFRRKNPYLIRFDRNDFNGLKPSKPPETEGFLDAKTIWEKVENKILPGLRFSIDVPIDDIKKLISSASVMKNPSMTKLEISEDGDVTLKIVEREGEYIGDDFELPLGKIEIPENNDEESEDDDEEDDDEESEDFEGGESWFSGNLSTVINTMSGDAILHFDVSSPIIIEQVVKLDEQKVGKEKKFRVIYLVTPAPEDGGDDDDESFDPEENAEKLKDDVDEGDEEEFTDDEGEE